MVLLLLTVRVGKADPNSKIYLIRHAAVDLQKPGWGTTKYSAEYNGTSCLKENKYPLNPFSVKGCAILLG